MFLIKRFFSDAEDIIDDVECEALRKRVVNTYGGISRKVRRFFSTSNPLVYRHRMAHQIKDIKKRLDKVGRDRTNFGLQINEVDTRVVHRRKLTHSRVSDSDVIEREHDKEKIIELLLQGGDDESLSVIPIVGIGGLGKTTLAKSVFNDKNIDDSFSLKMWVCVSDDFELQHVLIKILNSAPNPTQENYTNSEIEQLQSHVKNTLGDQKFLLILDDVWNEDLVKWVELKNLIQVGANGCKILVTTRSHSIATMMSTKSSNSYLLQGLSEEDSLSLLVKWACKEGEEKRYPELLEIGKDIVKKCGGLPLAVRTLGSSLFLKVHRKEWESVRDNEIWNSPQNENDILPALKFSYDQLPSYLKQCFSCFSLFPKDFDFYSFYVIELWEALGFLPSLKESETVEDVGNQYLHELRSRSFLQNFVDLGSTCWFSIHDLVHDLALYVAKDEFQLLNSQDQNISENTQHLSFTKSNLLDQAVIPTGLRTILFPVGANNEVLLKKLLSGCKYMRVLDLKDSRYQSLPRSIGKLKHLRYLSIEDNRHLERLPDSVCKLQNLRILNLSGCTKLQALPKGLKNLISLRQLNITTKQSNFSDKEIAKLTALENLSFDFCDNLESLLEGIQLPRLKLLVINSCRSVKFLPFHVIRNIETMRISNCSKLELSKGIENEIPKLRLKLLLLEDLRQLVTFPQWIQGCANTLQSLFIEDCYNLEELPEWMSTLICLKVLAIRNCPKFLSFPNDLNCLTNLEYLEITGCPILCKIFQPKIGQDWPKISHIKNVIIGELDDEGDMNS